MAGTGPATTLGFLWRLACRLGYGGGYRPRHYFLVCKFGNVVAGPVPAKASVTTHPITIAVTRSPLSRSISPPRPSRRSRHT